MQRTQPRPPSPNAELKASAGRWVIPSPKTGFKASAPFKRPEAKKVADAKQLAEKAASHPDGPSVPSPKPREDVVEIGAIKYVNPQSKKRAIKRIACNFRARIASADRDISTAGTIVNVSTEGAMVEVMYSKRGPSTVILQDIENDVLYECRVQWRTDTHIGVVFIDVFGPARRRMYREGEYVPIMRTDDQVIQLTEIPKGMQ